MIKYLIRKKEFLSEILIFVFVSIISIFIAFNWTKNGLLNPVDHQFPFDFIRATFSKFYTWNDYIYLGFNQALSLLHTLPYLAFFSIFQKIGFNYIVLNFLEYLFTILFSIYFTYLYLKLLFKVNSLTLFNKFNLIIVSSFMLSNLVNVALFSSGFTQQIFAFSFVPLTLYLLRKQLIANKFKYLFPLCISSVFLSVGNYPYTIISFILVFIINLTYIDFSFKTKIKSSILFSVIFLLVNSFWIIPFVYSGIFSPSLNFLKDFNSTYFSDYLTYVSTRYSLDYLFLFSQNYLLVKSQNGDNSFLVSYLGNYAFLFISYLVIFITFWFVFIFKKTKKEAGFIINNNFLLIYFLIFLFIAKGSNYPFGNLIQYTMEKSTFIKMFRDPLKLMLIPSFIFMLWLGNLIVTNKNSSIKFFLLFYIFLLSLPFFSNTFFGKFSSYEVPGYYFEFRNYLSNLPDSQTKRMLILDSLPDGMNYLFNINYYSSNLAKMISPIPTVELFSNGGGNSYYFLENIYKKIKGTDSDIYIFRTLGVTHLLKQRDARKGIEYSYTSKYFLKKSFGKLDLYILKDDLIFPQLFIKNENISDIMFQWKKINSTKYNIKIKNLKNKLNLSFLYTFDRNWKLYLTNKPDLYNKNSILTDLQYLQKKPIFDNSHKLVYDYANGWTIDPEYIKKNFDKSLFKQNPDGSIDIDLTLYFRPQSYMYLGLIISGSTLIFCLSYLVYDKVKQIKKNKTNEINII